jgi:hypothetical protein
MKGTQHMALESGVIYRIVESTGSVTDGSYSGRTEQFGKPYLIFFKSSTGKPVFINPSYIVEVEEIQSVEEQMKF